VSKLLPLLAMFASACLIPDSLILKVIDRDRDGEIVLGYHGEFGDGTDCNDKDPDIGAKVPETCGDGVDNDCDGQIDEDSADAPIWFHDADGDHFGNATRTMIACEQPPEHVANPTDCDDQQHLANPGAIERCNGFDDDCNGQIDEAGDPVAWYADVDRDGHGDPTVAEVQCERPPGYVQGATDCDDDNPWAFPGTFDVWYDGVDADCSGGDDFDQDGDGARDPSAWAGAPPWDAVVDCDDTNARISPTAPEVWYDGVDQDCDPHTEWDADGDGLTAAVAPVGAADDCDDNQRSIGAPVVWYPDVDGDGFGATNAGQGSCVPLTGHLTTAGDCDDANPDVNPNGIESCNAVDDDCDGLIDDHAGPMYWPDVDGDGYGDASASSQRSCDWPTGYTDRGGDCDDAQAAIRPGATEVCDGVDNNCSGLVDENMLVPFYPDNDDDGNGADPTGLLTIWRCPTPVPAGYVRVDPNVLDDCDDNDERQSRLHDEDLYGSLEEIENAGEEENYVWLCDGLDNDCNPNTLADPVDGCGIEGSGARFDWGGSRFMMPHRRLDTAANAEAWCEERGYHLWWVHDDDVWEAASVAGGNLGVALGTRIHVGARTQCPGTSTTAACTPYFNPTTGTFEQRCAPPAYEQLYWYDPTAHTCDYAQGDIGASSSRTWSDHRVIHYVHGQIVSELDLDVELANLGALILCEREIP
jgi:hypothetical protein